MIAQKMRHTTLRNSGMAHFLGLYVNSWGRAKEDLKNRSERSTAHSCLLGERGAMKDPVSEVIEVANAK